MNTGPIIGGTRDAEEFSFHDKRAQIPAILPVSPMYDPRENVPMMIPDAIETLRWVPFFYHIRNQEVRTGYWVSLNHETRNMRDDAEFHVYILMKLSERYKETLKEHYRRHIQVPRQRLGN